MSAKITNQQGDVHLYETGDGGEITASGGVIEMVPGLGVAAYLSLFGGNVEDPGLADKRFSWWGNFGEPVERQYRSETAHLLQSLPVTSANLLRIEDAVRRDLEWMLTLGIATTIEIEVAVPRPKRIDIVITIEAEGERETIAFSENWSASV